VSQGIGAAEAMLFLGGVDALAPFFAARRASRLAIPDALGHAG